MQTFDRHIKFFSSAYLDELLDYKSVRATAMEYSVRQSVVQLQLFCVISCKEQSEKTQQIQVGELLRNREMSTGGMIVKRKRFL